MELRQYWDILRRWLWLLALGTALAGGTAYVVSQLTTPIYRATATLMINQSTGATPVTDYTSLLTSQQLAQTYVELIKKRPTLDAVIQNLKLDETPERLLGQINVAIVRNTTLLTIDVDDPTPSRAKAIADEIARVFVAQVAETQHQRFKSSEDNLQSQMTQLQSDIVSAQKSLDLAHAANPPNQPEVSRLDSIVAQYQTSYTNLLSSFEALRTQEARTSDNVSVAESALLPKNPISPRTLLNTLLAAIVGAMLAVGIAFLVEYLDVTVKTPGDLAELELANIGTVGRIKVIDPSDGLVVAKDPRSPIAEAFRSLRTNIQFYSVDRPLRVILVTSPGPGDGKSTIAANLAAALAQGGQSVMLLDADLRRPAIHRLMGLSNNLGMTSALLREGGSLDDVVCSSSVQLLKAITSGPLPPNPAELLGSERFGRLIEELKQRYDVIVVDSPPCLVVTDAAVLSKRADGVLLVIETGATRRDAVQQAVDALRQVNAKLVGTVLNKLQPAGRSGYYNYQYYYYESQAGEKVKKHTRRSVEPRRGILSLLGRRNGSGLRSPADEVVPTVSESPRKEI